MATAASMLEETLGLYHIDEAAFETMPTWVAAAMATATVTATAMAYRRRRALLRQPPRLASALAPLDSIPLPTQSMQPRPVPTV